MRGGLQTLLFSLDSDLKVFIPQSTVQTTELFLLLDLYAVMLLISVQRHV